MDSQVLWMFMGVNTQWISMEHVTLVGWRNGPRNMRLHFKSAKHFDSTALSLSYVYILFLFLFWPVVLSNCNHLSFQTFSPQEGPAAFHFYCFCRSLVNGPDWLVHTRVQKFQAWHFLAGGSSCCAWREVSEFSSTFVDKTSCPALRSSGPLAPLHWSMIPVQIHVRSFEINHDRSLQSSVESGR